MPLFEGLIKYDFSSGSSQTHEFGAGRYGGEAVFVPRPGALLRMTAGSHFCL
jgi:carotenoid cleavage dioxygenase-like enzyme